MNERAFINDQIDKREQSSAIGVVTKIFEHTEPDDRSNHEANVKLVNNEEEFRRIPVHVTHSGHASVPQQGDFVEVDFVGGNTNRPFVASYAHDDDDRAPLARSGHWRHRFGPDGGDGLFLEAEREDHSAGDPDSLRMAIKEDGLSDPRLSIELDQSGAEPVVRLAVDTNDDGTPESEVTLDASGAITVRNDTAQDTTILGESSGNVVLESQSGDTQVLSQSGDVTAETSSGTATLNGDSVVLGTGGDKVILDVEANTTTDQDGHVTDVTLDITRSSVVESS